MWMSILAKNPPRTAKDNNLLEIERILNIKMQGKWGLVITFSLSGGLARPSATRK